MLIVELIIRCFTQVRESQAGEPPPPAVVHRQIAALSLGHLGVHSCLQSGVICKQAELLCLFC